MDVGRERMLAQARLLTGTGGPRGAVNRGSPGPGGQVDTVVPNPVTAHVPDHPSKEVAAAHLSPSWPGRNSGLSVRLWKICQIFISVLKISKNIVSLNTKSPGL